MLLTGDAELLGDTQVPRWHARGWQSGARREEDEGVLGHSLPKSCPLVYFLRQVQWCGGFSWLMQQIDSIQSIFCQLGERLGGQCPHPLPSHP